MATALVDAVKRRLEDDHGLSLGEPKTIFCSTQKMPRHNLNLKEAGLCSAGLVSSSPREDKMRIIWLVNSSIFDGRKTVEAPYC